MFIKLSESDLSIFFEVLLAFSLFIEKKMSKYILTSPPENRVELKVEILSENALKYFEPTFLIPIKKEKTVPLSSIMKSKEFEAPNVVVLQLYGTFAYIRKFYKALLKRVSAGEIKILLYNTLSLAYPTTKIRQFPWDDVEKVIELLPEKPWEKHIHKKIAQQLGWSNGKVHRIIDNIVMEQPVQIDIGRRRLELHVNDAYTFPISVTPKELLKDVVWQTSNSNIIEVQNGTITAISPGSANVFARILGNLSRSVCAVTVIE